MGWFSLEELPPSPHLLVRTALVHAMQGDRV